MSEAFFPKRPGVEPKIYAYSDKNYPGMLKVGYTVRSVKERVKEQYPINLPGERPWKIEFEGSAVRNDGTAFNDHAVHAVLKRLKCWRYRDKDGKLTEWFKCSLNQVKVAWLAVKNRTDNIEGRTQEFKMRREQEEAVKKTLNYFAAIKQDKANKDKTPKFLWNAKMRFGKTFAAYKLAKEMGAKRVLVLTFKPAVESAWGEDLKTHVDFEGWQFVSRGGLAYEDCDKARPIVCFGSFQDYLGTNESGGIKARNEWVHEINWDLVIFDEYHFGAWRDNAKKLFEKEDEDEYDQFDVEKYKEKEADNAFNEEVLPITTKHYLFLSGTPFRALNSGEFIEEQIYNWTYSDEQQRKQEESGNPESPYAALPRMVMMTYRVPDDIRMIAERGENDEFDLNAFFEAEGEGENARFKHEAHVQKWLNLIRGEHLPTKIDDLKLGKKPVMPYADVRLLNVLSHTLWFLPNVASCHAMANLLKMKQNTFYHDYKVVVCAGASAGVGLKALEPVREAMEDPLKSKTITLSCGKLTTGVTIKPWTGIFMLRNLSSPETYFQAAFRVQSPWTVKDEDGKTEILKRECYVFDFALDRALKQISDYSTRLQVEEDNPEKKVGEFIKFLPVLAYEGSVMRQIDAAEILDIAISGTSATLLAKRWESALLVNVDNATLGKLLGNSAAMEALMKIEGFRNLYSDIETIIAKSEQVKKAKREGGKLGVKEKKELTEAEKEYKSKRKMIQEKLMKFATRIPIFMYLTDHREVSLVDLIRHVESGLFTKVTGLTVKDFELLLSLNVFNSGMMSDAIYKFKRYEDRSLDYTGINRHDSDRKEGLFDTVIDRM